MAQSTAADHSEVSSLFLYIIYGSHGASLIQLRHAGFSFNSCYPVIKDQGNKGCFYPFTLIGHENNDYWTTKIKKRL